MNQRQRILLALVITFVFPVNILLATGSDILTGDILGRWMLIPTPIIVAVGVYFLSFKMWKREDHGAEENND